MPFKDLPEGTTHSYFQTEEDAIKYLQGLLTESKYLTCGNEVVERALVTFANLVWHSAIEQGKEKCGHLIHTRGWEGAPGPVYCANNKPCKIHEQK